MTTYAPVLNGPMAGQSTRIILREGFVSPTWCSKPPGQSWHHHVLDRDAGGYRFVGGCVDNGHTPTEWCEYRWHDDSVHDGEHECHQPGQHEMHVCRCGAEEPTDA